MVSWLSCRLLELFLQSLCASGPKNFSAVEGNDVFDSDVEVIKDDVAFRRMFHARAQRFSFGFASEALVRCWRGESCSFAHAGHELFWLGHS